MKWADFIGKSVREEHNRGITRWGGLSQVRMRRDVTDLALRSLLRFLPIRVTPRGKLVSNLAKAPKDNCFDLKSKEVNPVCRQDNILIFQGHKEKEF